MPSALHFFQSCKRFPTRKVSEVFWFALTAEPTHRHSSGVITCILVGRPKLLFFVDDVTLAAAGLQPCANLFTGTYLLLREPTRRHGVICFSLFGLRLQTEYAAEQCWDSETLGC